MLKSEEGGAMKAENIAAYIQEATTGLGPATPSLAYEPVDDAEVDESIRQVSQQWAEALARLEHL